MIKTSITISNKLGLHARASAKLTKLATELGVPTLKELGYASKIAFQDQKLRVLRTHP